MLHLVKCAFAFLFAKKSGKVLASKHLGKIDSVAG